MKRITLALCLLLAAGCASTGTGTDKAKVSEGYYNKGLAHLQSNDLELAYVEFHRAAQTDGKNKFAYYGLGLISERQRKLDDAEKFYKEAIDIDGNFSEAHNSLGVVYAQQQRWKEALREYNRALENKLYTTPHVPYLNIGNMYLAQREYPKAVEAFRESKRFVNQEITVYRLGMALLEAGKVKEAIAELQEGAKMAPGNPDMRLALGLAYLKDGNQTSALAEFRKVDALAPRSEAGRTARDYISTLGRRNGK